MDNFPPDNEHYYQQRQAYMRRVKAFSGLQDPRLANPVSMTDVQLKVADFQYKLKEINGALQGAHPFMRINDQDNFYTQFYIDRAALARLFAIAARDEFARFGVFYGLEDPKSKRPLEDLKAPGLGQLTCCFVGLDKDNKVMDVHFPGPDGSKALMMAEETWPPPPPPPNTTGKVLNLTTSTTQVFAFFNKPAVAVAEELV